MPALIDTRNVRRGTHEYDEVTRILGARARWVLDEGARQINQRWLKADCLVPDEHGQYTVVDGELLVKSRRIRIPKDSFLRKRTFTHGRKGQ